MTSDFDLTDDTPVYVISVAAQLSGLHPQTLRAYDRLGLVSPGRSAGRGRRYSLRDILNLREVQRLSQEEGINLHGIKRILELELAERRSRMMITDLHAEISQLRAELESTRAVAARLANLARGKPDGAALVPVRPPAGGRTATGTGLGPDPAQAIAAGAGGSGGRPPGTAAAAGGPGGRPPGTAAAAGGPGGRPPGTAAAAPADINPQPLGNVADAG